MSFLRKEFLFILIVLCSVFLANGQEKTQDSNDGIADPAFVNVSVIVSVHSSKEGYLKNLTYKDFVVFDEKERKQIEFFIFDEPKNQYIIGFYKNDYISGNNRRNVKVKVKLSAEKKKQYGKIFVSGQNGYYPNQN